MPFGSITLLPGVNVERTPLLLRAGVSTSQLIRYRDSLIQKYGGWQKYYPNAVGGIPRDLHAWQDLAGDGYLSIGTTTQLAVINDNALSDISPQVLTSDFAPNISTTINTATVDIVDPNISNVTIDDAVLFNVPVTQGGLVLSGLYQITEITGAHSYQITASTNATTTNTNPTATNNTTASGNNTLHFASTPSWVKAGMVVADITTSGAIPASTTVVSKTSTTVVMSNDATGSGVSSGDDIVFASVPVVTTTSGSATGTGTGSDHQQTVGSSSMVRISTTCSGSA